jgi:hypothetical protein
MRYEIDRARIILERFEEETVLVNIESGYYYSVSSAGSEILELLEEGFATDDLAPALFGDSETLNRFRIRIAQFVEKLAVEGIVVERDSASNAGPCFHKEWPRYPDGAGYEPPMFERFDDVRDLLLIDPVHQVDLELGWPKKRPSASPIEPRA